MYVREGKTTADPAAFAFAAMAAFVIAGLLVALVGPEAMSMKLRRDKKRGWPRTGIFMIICGIALYGSFLWGVSIRAALTWPRIQLMAARSLLTGVSNWAGGGVRTAWVVVSETLHEARSSQGPLFVSSTWAVWASCFAAASVGAGLWFYILGAPTIEEGALKMRYVDKLNTLLDGWYPPTAEELKKRKERDQKKRQRNQQRRAAATTNATAIFDRLSEAEATSLENELLSLDPAERAVVEAELLKVAAKSRDGSLLRGLGGLSAVEKEQLEESMSGMSSMERLLLETQLGAAQSEPAINGLEELSDSERTSIKKALSDVPIGERCAVETELVTLVNKCKKGSTIRTMSHLSAGEQSVLQKKLEELPLMKRLAAEVALTELMKDVTHGGMPSLRVIVETISPSLSAMPGKSDGGDAPNPRQNPLSSTEVKARLEQQLKVLTPEQRKALAAEIAKRNDSRVHGSKGVTTSAAEGHLSTSGKANKHTAHNDARPVWKDVSRASSQHSSHLESDSAAESDPSERGKWASKADMLEYKAKHGTNEEKEALKLLGLL